MAAAHEVALFAAVRTLELDPERGTLPLDLLVAPSSMWQTTLDIRRLTGKPFDPAPFFDADSLFHPSRLFAQQKRAIVRAVAYFFYPTNAFWADNVEADEEADASGLNPAPNVACTVPEAASSLRSSDVQPVQQRQAEPPGSGKTLVLFYVALLTSRNALIVTDKRDNVIQLLNAALAHTRIAEHFSLKVVRPNAREDGSARQIPAEHLVMAAEENSGFLDRDGVYGIALIDVKSFQQLTNSSDKRVDLRTTLFATHWSIVLIDEADFVCAEQMRRAFTRGVDAEVSQAERLTTPKDALKPSQLTRRYRLRYDKLLAVSGTMHRGDVEGLRFLRQLGPLTFRIGSRVLENEGHLAKMHIALVKCVDSPAIHALAKEHEFAEVTPSKLRVVQALVAFHTAHGQKIMVFCNRHWHLRLLERLLPFGLAPSGGQSNEANAAFERQFKAEITPDHPLVWLTISHGEVGFDAPDTSVVINLVNSGESKSRLKQRMGRAHRKVFKFAWFYDLVGEHETPWAPQLAGAPDEEGAPLPSLRDIGATRYDLLVRDGYEPHMLRATSDELLSRLNEHVQLMPSLLAADDDAMHIVAHTAERLGKINVFGTTHWPLATTDHLVACVWGSPKFFEREETRRDDTLFDTQSALALSDCAASKEEDRARRELEKKRDALTRKLNGKLGIRGLSMKKRPKSPRSKTPEGVLGSSAQSASSTAPASRRPLFLTEDQYLERFKTIKKSFSGNAAMRKAVAEQLRLLPEFKDATEAPAELWSDVLKLRARANEQQFRADEQRSEAVRSVLQMSEPVQERCSWLR